MKTSVKYPPRAGSRWNLREFFFLIPLVSFGLVPCSAEDPSGAPPDSSPRPAATVDSGAAEKTHTLFMGADIDIEQNRRFFRAQGMARNSFVISVGGRETLVPMDRGPVNMKVFQELKLTESSATVLDLKGERAYTPGNDPIRRMQRGLADSENSLAGSEAAKNLYATRLQNFESQNYAADHAQDGGRYRRELDAALADAGTKYNAAVAGPGTMDLPANTEGQFDAMEVSFSVSSSRRLDRPYVVIVARYHEPDSRPGVYRNWIYAHALDPIGRETKPVRFLQGGFPPGFKIDDFQLHLYNRNEEIATTVAPRRVALTRDEAFQYLLIEYVSGHKGATLPAVPAMGKLPADLPQRLAGGEFNQTYFVKVSADGIAVETYLDESCTQKAENRYLESVVKNIRFNPALEKGHPVEGVARLKLGELTML